MGPIPALNPLDKELIVLYQVKLDLKALKVINELWNVIAGYYHDFMSRIWQLFKRYLSHHRALNL